MMKVNTILHYEGLNLQSVVYLNLLVKGCHRIIFRFCGKKYSFTHFERQNASQNT